MLKNYTPTSQGPWWARFDEVTYGTTADFFRIGHQRSTNSFYVSPNSTPSKLRRVHQPYNVPISNEPMINEDIVTPKDNDVKPPTPKSPLASLTAATNSPIGARFFAGLLNFGRTISPSVKRAPQMGNTGVQL